jgi:4-hydroxy-tetrahydrodipicolinate synthase
VFSNFSNKLNITVGICGNNTNEMIEEIKILNETCHNIMILQPTISNHITCEGFYQHFKLLIDSTTKPIIIGLTESLSNNIYYDKCITLDTIKNICTYSDRVIGINNIFNNVEQIIELKELSPNLLIWTGNDNLILPSLSVGAYGVVSMISNITPKLLAIIIFAFETGNNKSAYDTFYATKNLFKLCSDKSNYVSVKYILSLLYNENTMENTRLPFINLTDKSKDSIKLYLSLIHI